MEILFDRTFRYFNGGIFSATGKGTGLSVVSSAEVPGAWKYDKPVCTDVTAALLSVVRREFRPLVLPYGRTMNLGSLSITLYPSGPLPGGAAALLQDQDGQTLFCPGCSDDSVKLPRASTLAVSVTIEESPSEAAALDDLVGSVRTAIKAGMVPVIACNPFGVARVVCSALSAAGIVVREHKGVARFNRVWRLRGYDAGACVGFRGGRSTGGAVVMPAHASPGVLDQSIPNPWRIRVRRAGDPAGSVDSPDRFDQTIVLPGLASLPALLKLTSRVRPTTVVLSGDGAGPALAALADIGIQAVVADTVRQFRLL